MRKRIFSQLPVYSNPHANETMARYLQSNISQLFQTKHSVRKSGVISSRRKKILKVFYNLLSVLFLRPFISSKMESVLVVKLRWHPIDTNFTYFLQI